MSWLVLLLCLAPPAAGGGPAEGLEVRLQATPRRATAELQLEHALAVRRTLRGQVGAARRAARAEAVEACRAVRRYHPAADAAVAEASFRAGELLRSGGLLDEAVGEFEHAWRSGRRSSFGPRGGLEAGHTLRRLGRRVDALGWYESVEVLGETWAEERDLAAFWRGRVLEELGRPRDARRSFERAARNGVAPVQRVRAFDAWAASLVEEGDLEAAAGVLELCRESLQARAAERTLLGLRVRGALEGMRTPRRLSDAVRSRRRQQPPPPRREAPPTGAVGGASPSKAAGG